MIRVRKSGVPQRLNVIAQVQFIGRDRVINAGVQRAFQRMLKVNAAARAARVFAKMPLDARQIIGCAPAIRVEARQHALRRFAHVVKASERFVHANLPGQADAGILDRQVGKVKQVEDKTIIPVLFCPRRRFRDGFLILQTNFRRACYR